MRRRQLADALSGQRGPFRPAYNAQIAVVPRPGIIVAVEMTDRRNDAGLAMPMVDQLVNATADATLLIDTRYATAEDIATLSEHAAGPVKVYTPPPSDRQGVKPETLVRRARERAREPDSVKEWRSRMATQAGTDVYARRKLIERDQRRVPQKPRLRLHSGAWPCSKAAAACALACARQ